MYSFYLVTSAAALWPGIIHIWPSCDLVISAATLFEQCVTLLFLLLILYDLFFCSLVYDLLWPYCYCYSLFDLFVSLLFLLLIIWPFSCCSLYVLLWLCNFCCSWCEPFFDAVISAAHFMTCFNLIIFAAHFMTFKLCYFCCLLFDLVISAAHRMTSINFPIWKYNTWVTFWYTNVHHLDKMFKLSNCIMI